MALFSLSLKHGQTWEVARTNFVTGIESARVHIASPEASLYSTTQQPTTASVAIQTKVGMQLNAQEVRGATGGHIVP